MRGDPPLATDNVTPLSRESGVRVHLMRCDRWMTSRSASSYASTCMTQSFEALLRLLVSRRGEAAELVQL